MATHTDPQTGRRTESDLVTPAANSASWGIATLVIVLALLGWFAYGVMDRAPTTGVTTTPGATTTDVAPAPQPANPAPPNANTAPEAPPTTP